MFVYITTLYSFANLVQVLGGGGGGGELELYCDGYSKFGQGGCPPCTPPP